MSTPAAIVYGDIVLDCHLYGGVKTAATSFQEPGSVYREVPGGAELSLRLLEAAAAKAPPEKIYTVTPGLVCGDLKNNLPQHLHSFGVWTSYLPKKDAKEPTDKVWRIKRHFGYGPRQTPKTTPVCPLASGLPENPALLMLDDGGILYRHRASEQAWPNFASAEAGRQPWIVFKMSAPLCRGDLWPKLMADKQVMARLILVVSAEDLRREDVQIRRRLSWEQTAGDTLAALHQTPVGQQLLKAAHVIVNFKSAGALWLHRIQEAAEHSATLVFDPMRLEGDYSREFEGSVYGFQSCLAVALAHHLLLLAAADNHPADKTPSEAEAALAESFSEAVTTGIVTGLNARRKLLELGHGKVGCETPGFPIDDVAQVIAGPGGGYGTAKVPALSELNGDCPWTILTSLETDVPSKTPLIGLAQLTARFGRAALSDVPCLSMGGLYSVDRMEIESLRMLEGLIRAYEDGGAQKKPLSIGVFGPPGAGKSFGVKALAKAILGKDVPFLEFNLSQFKDTTDLIGAFHRVRDEVLKGATPVAFWDEFDSRSYHWLQYLLAPMQDGAFQEGQVTHPIGKCIFIFAGGTADTLEEFGVKRAGIEPEERGKLHGTERKDRPADAAAWQEYKLLKGPDFVSRLHGHLNVLGPNPKASKESSKSAEQQPCQHDDIKPSMKASDGQASKPDCPDRTYPIRRALMLRGILGLKDGPKKCDELDMDAGLLYALLSAKRYEHGSRSFEKILLTLAKDIRDGHYHRSALPPDPLLDLETNAKEFHDTLNQRNAFRTHPDIEELAAAIHKHYLNNAVKNNWPIKPEMDKPYAELTSDGQDANRAAARRIPELLSLIDFKVVQNSSAEAKFSNAALSAHIAVQRERLAQGEHLGWMAERLANGWSYAKERNDAHKQHHLLVPWANLTDPDKNKDRENMDAIPAVLELAKYHAESVRTTK